MQVIAHPGVSGSQLTRNASWWLFATARVTWCCNMGNSLAVVSLLALPARPCVALPTGMLEVGPVLHAYVLVC